MHEKLKFSFGHIIAFVVLIFWGYVTFVGVTYYTGGNYMFGGIIAAIISVLLLLLLFRLQLLKSVNQQFEKYIKHERAALVVFTLVCCIAFVPYSHFWTVESHRDDIKNSFEQSLQVSRKLFSEYDAYSAERIAFVESKTDSLDLHSDDNVFIRHHAMLRGLRLQLLPEKYINLERKSLEWVEQSEKTISIWNVFLMGNIDVISNSMQTWHSVMSGLSEYVTDEEKNYTGSVQPFDCLKIVDESTAMLNTVTPMYMTAEFPKPMAWITGFIAIFLLYLPWIIQRRSPKSLVTLCGIRNIKSKDSRKQVLDEGKRINTEKRGMQLEETGHVQTERHGQTLDGDSQKPTSNRKALTLD